MNFSKSKYCAFWQCPKMAWLKKFKPEECADDAALTSRLSTGNEVGDLAMGLFGDYTDVTTVGEDGSLDLAAMVQKTGELIAKRAENICEASFDFVGLYCAVDVLHREGGGYAIYEVKSSTHLSHIYVVDIAYQKYVLQKCGVGVTGTYLVHIDGGYEFDGTLDIKKLFKIENVSLAVDKELQLVEKKLAEAEKILDGDEPSIKIGMHCKDPYDCGFWKYCTAGMPERNVFDIYRLPFKKKLELYHGGIVSYADLYRSGELDDPIRQRQVEYALADKGTYVERDNIKKFLAGLSYPLYFLDFESMQLAVPQFPKSRPYEQIPFQYSLHYIEKDGDELKHKEFLAVSGEDPRRPLAERLVGDIPQNVCVVAYNKAFECSRIRALAELFPDLRSKLENIANNVVDLIVPFQRGYYYNARMGGSFSIKSVLPAVFPNDPSLNYHNLDGVHNGTEAMEVFPTIKDMPKADAEKTRQALLEYCKLDTLAMVKLWQELKNVTEAN